MNIPLFVRGLASGPMTPARKSPARAPPTPTPNPGPKPPQPPKNNNMCKKATKEDMTESSESDSLSSPAAAD